MNSEIAYPKEKYLWKFLDLYKFLSFVQTKQLYFSNLNDFEDIMESATKDHYCYINGNRFIADTDVKIRNPSMPIAEFEQKERDILNIYTELSNYRKNKFCSCFFESNSESIAMWNLYSKFDGIAIRFDAESLINFVKNYHLENLCNDFRLTTKNVTYDKLNIKSPYDEVGRIILTHELPDSFKKDNVFSHEKEFRILFEKINIEYYNPIVQLQELSNVNFEVFVNSTLEEWKIQVLNKILAENEFSKPVMRSDILSKGLIEKYQKNYLKKIIDKHGYYIQPY